MRKDRSAILFSQQHPQPIRIGIIRSSSIGDVVLATACVNLLRQWDMPTKITWIGSHPSLGLIQSYFPEIETLDWKRGDSAGSPNNVSEHLSNTHFVIDLQKSWRSHLLCRSLEKLYDTPIFTYNKAGLERNKLILAARVRGRRRPLPETTSAVHRFQFDMMVDALRQGLKWHLPIESLDGIHQIKVHPYLPMPETLESDPAWAKELAHGQWLAIAPGASYVSKRAPSEYFFNILETLQSKILPSRVLGLTFLGDESDRPIATEILDKLQWPTPTLNLAGKLTLAETARALSKAKHLLSNDSSVAHISEAVETPVTMLFGPTAERFGFGPRMPASLALSAPLGCRPCSKHGSKDCRFSDLRCFWDIPIGKVVAHLMNSLDDHE